jgi:hypothetical protein
LRLSVDLLVTLVRSGDGIVDMHALEACAIVHVGANPTRSTKPLSSSDRTRDFQSLNRSLILRSGTICVSPSGMVPVLGTGITLVRSQPRRPRNHRSVVRTHDCQSCNGSSILPGSAKNGLIV